MPERSLTALVLCGGLGTRLRPIINDVPKALAPIAGQPFIDHLLRLITTSGVNDIVLCTGFGAEQIVDYCGDGARWRARIRYSREPTPLGTGGALKNAQSLIASTAALVLNGDSLVAVDLHALAHSHQAKGARITMAVTEVPDQQRFGSVVMNDDGSVHGFREKGASGRGWINAGVYTIDRAVIEAIPPRRPVSLEQEVFPRYLGDGLFAMKTFGAFMDIGTPSSYEEAQRAAVAK